MREQLLPLPRETPQQCINQARGPLFTQQFRALRRGVYCRMVWRLIFPELKQSDKNQVLNILVASLEGGIQELSGYPLERTQPAKDAIGQVPGKGLVARGKGRIFEKWAR